MNVLIDNKYFDKLDNPIDFEACFYDKMKMFKWAISSEGLNLKPIPDTLSLSCSLGIIEYFKLIVDKGVFPVEEDLLNLAYFGNLDKLQYLHEKGLLLKNEHILAVAVAATNGGEFETLKWLASIGVKFNWTVAQQAAAKSNFKILQWLYENFDLLPINMYEISHIPESILYWIEMKTKEKKERETEMK